MITQFPLQRILRDHGRPAKLADVLVSDSASGSHTADIVLGLPTCSARTRQGDWALYSNGGDVVVLWPGGAITGRPAEVVRQLDRELADTGRRGGLRWDELDLAASAAIGRFLTDPAAGDAVAWSSSRAETASSPAAGYAISGMTNQIDRVGQPSSWPGAPGRVRRPLTVLPEGKSPEPPPPGRAKPDPRPTPAPQRAA
jgi:hypothetical protein